MTDRSAVMKMLTFSNAGRVAGAAGLLAALVVPLVSDTVSASDHQDAPKATANPPADLSDLSAWHTDDGKIVVVLGFAGGAKGGEGPKFDPKVVYGLHLDNNEDNEVDIDVWIRFGQNAEGKWGVRVENLPGGDAKVSACRHEPDNPAH